METKDMLLGFAARIDQILHEIRETASSKQTPFFAGHEMMVAYGLLQSGSRYLAKTAAKYE